MTTMHPKRKQLKNDDYKPKHRPLWSCPVCAKQRGTTMHPEEKKAKT